MTTKFLDNKICICQILLSWGSPRKTAFFCRFSSLPPCPPPPQKRKFCFYCRLAISDCLRCAHHQNEFPCVPKQCPADSVWRIDRGGSPDRVLKTRFTPSESSAGHGLPPLREHLNSVQRMVSGGYCEGLFPDTVCWTRLRNTWNFGTWLKNCGGDSRSSLMRFARVPLGIASFSFGNSLGCT